jgi:Uma2 family endonuclease
MTCVMHEREVEAPRRMPIELAHAAHDNLELPEGFQAEIIEGQIVIVATPNVKHALIVGDVHEALSPALPKTYKCLQVLTGQEPEGDRYIPDLGAWPLTVMREDESRWLMSAGDLLIAVEVTSPGSEDDDYAKAAGYARAEVPIYLLVDRKRRRCILHTEPKGGEYRNVHVSEFGETVTIPLETPVELATDW